MLHCDWPAAWLDSRERGRQLGVALRDPSEASAGSGLCRSTFAFRTLAQAGALAASWSPELGGEGFGPTQVGLLHEGFGLGGGCAGLASAWAVHSGLCGSAIAAFGTPEQKERYLPRMATGEWIAAWAGSEAPAGFDGDALATVALRERDRFRLEGTKPMVVNAPIAHHFVVVAKTNSATDQNGVSCFVVERDHPGVTVGEDTASLGTRRVAPLTLRRCDLPIEAQLGRVGADTQVWPYLHLWLTSSFHAYWVGAMEASLEACVMHARQQNGFAGSQFNRKLLADMKIRHRQSSLLTYRAAQSFEHDEPSAELHGTMAEIFRREAALKTFHDAAELLPESPFATCQHRRRWLALMEPPRLVGDISTLEASVAATLLHRR